MIPYLEAIENQSVEGAIPIPKLYAVWPSPLKLTLPTPPTRYTADVIAQFLPEDSAWKRLRRREVIISRSTFSLLKMAIPTDGTPDPIPSNVHTFPRQRNPP